MATDNINRLPDREFLAKYREYNNTTLTAPETFGITQADADALKTDLNDFEADLNAWDSIQTDYDARLEAKNESRSKVKVRGSAQRGLTRAKQDISNENLASAGLTPYDDVRTPSASPTSAPFALVDYGKLRHTIRFRDKNTPDTDKKPDGMMGAEIWLKIGGEPPVDNKECEFLALDTATPYLNTFDAADAGKTAYYLLRWVSKNGDKGEWSEPVGATING